MSPSDLEFIAQWLLGFSPRLPRAERADKFANFFAQPLDK